MKCRMIEVEDGDTLGAITGRYLGADGRWPELYAANADTIKAEHRKRGLKIGKPPIEHFRHPANLIFAGTKLVIPCNKDTR